MAHIPAALLALGKLSTAICDVTFGTRERLQVPTHSHPTRNHAPIAGEMSVGAKYQNP